MPSVQLVAEDYVSPCVAWHIVHDAAINAGADCVRAVQLADKMHWPGDLPIEFLVAEAQRANPY